MPVAIITSMVIFGILTILFGGEWWYLFILFLGVGIDAAIAIEIGHREFGLK